MEELSLFCGDACSWGEKAVFEFPLPSNDALSSSSLIVGNSDLVLGILLSSDTALGSFLGSEPGSLIVAFFGCNQVDW